jgi:nucleoside-diphosphate-sugar epimerase
VKVLVIGASGFVGRHLIDALFATQGTSIIAASRNRITYSPAIMQVGLPNEYRSLGKDDELKLFAGVEVVFLLAAATPSLLTGKSKEEKKRALDTNVNMPLFFAKAAQRHGVKHFIFLSSCGVHGAVSDHGAFSETSPFNGHDSYTKSKIAAEQLLLSDGALRPILTIVRPPSVYGRGFRGPVRQLMRLVEKQWPLPFGGATKNSRQFVGVRNLCDFLVTCAGREAAKGEAFLVADQERISARELLDIIAAAGKLRSRQFNVPVGLLFSVGKCVGLKSQMSRLLGNYEIDISKCKSILGWTPPFTLREEFQEIYRMEGAKKL